MPTHAELMQSIHSMDAALKSNDMVKSQIVQGGNSSVNQWAGSDHSDQNTPRPAPNGTDYVPQQGITHKSVDQMSTAELEAYLAFRKSGKPNLQAALFEIEQTLGDQIQKSLCASCMGQGCGVCGHSGVKLGFLNDQAGEIAKAIADKWNCGPNNNPNMHKAQNYNAGGAGGEADPTPTTAQPEIKPKVDNGGLMVGKGGEEGNPAGGAMGGEQPGPEGQDVQFSKSENILAQGLEITMKGLQQLQESQRRMEELLAGQIQVQQSMVKSMTGQQVPTQPTQPQPSRGAQSVGTPGSGLRIEPLQKGMPPNGQNLGHGAGTVNQGQDGSETVQYDLETWRTLKKSASDMVFNGMLDPSHVVRMDSDIIPDVNTMAKIEAWSRGERPQGWNQTQNGMQGNFVNWEQHTNWQ